MDTGILELRRSRTCRMSLADVVGRLKGNPDVIGLVVMGSGGRGELKPESDYDILLFLGQGPMPYRFIFTFVDGRMTDVMLSGREMLEKLAAGGPFSPGSIERVLERHVRTGEVFLDRDGLLERVRSGREPAPDSAPPAEMELYRTWNYINYNLKQAERYARSKDKWRLLGLELRLQYSITAVIVGYLMFRGREWHGEKEGLKFLSKKAPAFYRLVRGYFRERDLRRRLGLFRRMAMKALEPVGGVWPDDVTVLSPVGESDREAIRRALDEWDALFPAIPAA